MNCREENRNWKSLGNRTVYEKVQRKKQKTSFETKVLGNFERVYKVHKKE